MNPQIGGPQFGGAAMDPGIGSWAGHQFLNPWDVGVGHQPVQELELAQLMLHFLSWSCQMSESGMMMMIKQNMAANY